MTRRFAAGAALVAGFLAGCGEAAPQPVTVTGAVTLDGSPVGTGNDSIIRFDPAGPGDSRAVEAPVADGRYTAPVIPGKYKVTATWAKRKPGKPSGTGLESNYVSPDDYIEMIPAKYSTGTTLSADVAPDKAVHDFALTTK